MNKTPDAYFTHTLKNPQVNTVRDVTVNDVKDNIKDLVLIDVRRTDEWVGELGHIGQATLITLDTLNDHWHKIPKDKPVVFVCRSGARSGQASYMAAQNGFPNTYNMQGGMIAWNAQKFPIEK